MWELVVAFVATTVLLVALPPVGRWLAAQDWKPERAWSRRAGLLPRRPR